jgi:hypothetical protein
MMNGGVKNLLVVASFAAAGCASGPSAVEVRPIANPGSKLRPGVDLLADAKGQLAIGNVGLALEGFRKAARDYPDNPEAFAGMAACYEAMRRYDLAELKYQEALALAPHSLVLLGRLAAMLDQQGKATAAAEVRGEIAQLASASDALDQAEADPETAVASLAPSQTVRVALPAPELKPAPAVTVALPPPELKPTQTVTVALPATTMAASNVIALPGPDFTARAETAPMPRFAAADLVDRQPLNLLPDGSNRLNQLSVGPLAPALALASEPVLPRFPAPVLASNVRLNVVGGMPQQLGPVAIGSLAPVLAEPEEISAPAMLSRNVAATAVREPRLERLSLGEVALLTSGGPAWKPQVGAATAPRVAVRWQPMTTASVTRPNIRLLNAARVQGLAARNREYLLDRGWRKIEIADASATRERSLVLYPMMRPQTGRSLAAQFGFRAQPAMGTDVFVVLLGRDAAALRTTSSRG